MIIRTTDIPAEGRDLHFELNPQPLNERVEAVRRASGPDAVGVPPYVFEPPIDVRLNLRMEGSTVVINGAAHGRYTTPCSRCVEDTTKETEVPINMLLKPQHERASVGANDEDVSFGFYQGEEIDCSQFTEELLILALPFSVLCSEECKGLCPSCGANLNQQPCACKPAEHLDERFSILRQLKVQ